MGLTVYWKLNFKGSRESVNRIFQSLAQEIQEISLGKPVSGPFFISDGECQNPDSKNHIGHCLFLSDRNKEGDPLYPEEMYLVIGDPGPGSEKAHFYLGRYGGETEWVGSGFCKTQYAEHFVESHSALLEWLDVFREAGVKTEVMDEGNYWETRDVAQLLEAYERYNGILEAFTDKLQESGLKVEGAAPDYNKRRKNRLN